MVPKRFNPIFEKRAISTIYLLSKHTDPVNGFLNEYFGHFRLSLSYLDQEKNNVDLFNIFDCNKCLICNKKT